MADVKKCPFCHAVLDPIWDGKDECNRWACYVQRAPAPLSEPITGTEGAKLAHKFAARLRKQGTGGFSESGGE